jgi:hypothetical protein
VIPFTVPDVATLVTVPPEPVATVIGKVVPLPFVKVIVFEDTDAVTMLLPTNDAVVANELDNAVVANELDRAEVANELLNALVAKDAVIAKELVTALDDDMAKEAEVAKDALIAVVAKELDRAEVANELLSA